MPPRLAKASARRLRLTPLQPPRGGREPHAVFGGEKTVTVAEEPGGNPVPVPAALRRRTYQCRVPGAPLMRPVRFGVTQPP